MTTTDTPRRTPSTAHERCTRIVERLAQVTGQAWTFGYIGNCDATRDDRSWSAFAPHPGRAGTADDRIGGVATKDLDKLATMLSGALAFARTQTDR